MVWRLEREKVKVLRFEGQRESVRSREKRLRILGPEKQRETRSGLARVYLFV